MTDAFGQFIAVDDYFVYGIVSSGTIRYAAGRVVSVSPMSAVTASQWGGRWELHKGGKPIRRDIPGNMVIVERDRLPADLVELLG